ncbi:MAG TPA: hypothetical protein VI818_05995, partial [Candidatus Thermoplasmatota archaeon]|nr:hypothetical protein [Candidatus Thermoplasmatota archaeon]
EGFQQDDAGPRRPLRPIHESETIELYNKTGFDGVRLKIVVLARSDAEMRFGVAVDILEGLAEAPPDFTSQLPAALPDGLRPSQVLRPANTSRGFLLSGFYEAWSTRVSYVLQSRTMEVTRKAGAEAPSFAGGLRVSGAHPSAGGWTLVSALFHSVAGVASFKVDAEYRGRATRAEGLGADAMGLGGSPAGSAAVPIHFGYVSGDGPSRFTMDIDYADHPQAHRFQYLRIDVDDDMSALLGGRVFELWKDEKRIAG